MCALSENDGMIPWKIFLDVVDWKWWNDSVENVLCCGRVVMVELRLSIEPPLVHSTRVILVRKFCGK